MIKQKSFSSDLLAAKNVPDGTSLDEKVNVFLATIDEKKLKDVVITSQLSGKFGVNEQHFATVLYQE